MKSLFNRQAERFVRERKRYKRWMAMFLCLAIVVSSGTYASLSWEGRALDEEAQVQVVNVDAETDAAAADGNGADIDIIETGAGGEEADGTEGSKTAGAPEINDGGGAGNEPPAAGPETDAGEKEDASDRETGDNRTEDGNAPGGGK